MHCLCKHFTTCFTASEIFLHFDCTREPLEYIIWLWQIGAHIFAYRVLQQLLVYTQLHYHLKGRI